MASREATRQSLLSRRQTLQARRAALEKQRADILARWQSYNPRRDSPAAKQEDLGRLRRGYKRTVDRELSVNTAQMKEVKAKLKITNEAIQRGTDYGRVRADIGKEQYREEKERQVTQQVNVKVRPSGAPRRETLQKTYPSFRSDEKLGDVKVYRREGDDRGMYIPIEDISKLPQDARDWIGEGVVMRKRQSVSYSKDWEAFKDQRQKVVQESIVEAYGGEKAHGWRDFAGKSTSAGVTEFKKGRVGSGLRQFAEAGGAGVLALGYRVKEQPVETLVMNPLRFVGTQSRASFGTFAAGVAYPFDKERARELWSYREPAKKQLGSIAKETFLYGGWGGIAASFAVTGGVIRGAPAAGKLLFKDTSGIRVSYTTGGKSTTALSTALKQYQTKGISKSQATSTLRALKAQGIKAHARADERTGLYNINLVRSAGRAPLSPPLPGISMKDLGLRQMMPRQSKDAQSLPRIGTDKVILDLSDPFKGVAKRGGVKYKIDVDFKAFKGRKGSGGRPRLTSPAQLQIQKIGTIENRPLPWNRPVRTPRGTATPILRGWRGIGIGGVGLGIGTGSFAIPGTRPGLGLGLGNIGGVRGGSFAGASYTPRTAQPQGISPRQKQGQGMGLALASTTMLSTPLLTRGFSGFGKAPPQRPRTPPKTPTFQGGIGGVGRGFWGGFSSSKPARGRYAPSLAVAAGGVKGFNLRGSPFVTGLEFRGM